MKSIRNRALMGLATTAALVAMVASAGVAQRSGGQGAFGGFGGFGAAPAPIVKSNAEGVYVLTNGTLIKYSTALQEKGQVKLQEPPKPPADSSTPQMMPRPVPGAMLLTSDSKVVVVLGDQLYSVDAALSQTPVKISLPSMQTPPQAPNNDNNSGPGQGMRQFTPPPPAPSLELQGQIVYVVRGTEIVAVDLAANKVLGLASLPKPPVPTRPNNN